MATSKIKEVLDKNVRINTTYDQDGILQIEFTSLSGNSISFRVVGTSSFAIGTNINGQWSGWHNF